MIEFKGSRWYKCDLHLHTTASKCFEDHSVTAEQWVDRAIEQGLHCVAVTDHNTGAGIDEILNASESKNLTVFPGVEITCDSTKIHLLVLFDVDKTSQNVQDFLVRADIKREQFGEQTASTTKSIFEIVALAHTDGALVIPAHIDEYNGLGSVSVANLVKLYTECQINAVQVVHREFLNITLQTTGNTELKQALNDYYNNPNPAIEDATVKSWFTPVKYALENDIAILTFSDNPHEEKNPKHGLWGIGNRFTWIKMDEKPTLEGLRQAFLLPKFRIINDFNAITSPNVKPSLWLKSLSVTNTSITDTTANPFQVDFNPQLNAIIGGRGSGKSSILRFIRGVFNRTSEITHLNDILIDQQNFYKKEDARSKIGIIQDDSSVEIEFVRNGVLHKITAENITNSDSQDIKIKKLNETENWEEVEGEGYIDFFKFDHFSQKQIYEIAQKPNALRERIDKAIPKVQQLQNDKELVQNQFLEKSAEIRTYDTSISAKGRIETQIEDLNESIKKFQESGISVLLGNKNNFRKEEILLTDFSNQIEERKTRLDEMIDTFEISNINETEFRDEYQEELKQISQSAKNEIEKIKNELQSIHSKVDKILTDYQTNLDSSQWSKVKVINQTNFDTKKGELEKEGIDDITNFEQLTAEKTNLEAQLNTIQELADKRTTAVAIRSELQEKHLEICKKITAKRKEFIASLGVDDKIKIEVKPFRNKSDFEESLRTILQREGRYESDIDNLIDFCFNGNVEQKIKDFRQVILAIRNDEDVTDSVSVTGHFLNLIKQQASIEQIDKIECFLPENEIAIKYKPNHSSPFKALSTVSAGQKTTAILTFLLSYGDNPLILDQPEDDLDNRLVYDLIVDRLKQAKEHRQILVVTHNANIPVNGDAEYIISMDTESKKLKVLHTGTVEQKEIKREICDVMEGGEKAFSMRSKRYKQLND